MIGRRQPRHLEHRVGDDLGLAAFFGADARIGPAGVDEADDRHVELGGQLHLGHRLAIAFGMGVAVIAEAAFLERLALLMADDHHLEGVELGPAGADRPIVAETLVAVQFDELVEDQFEIVGGHGPIGMPGDLDLLPRLQVGVDLFDQIDALAAQAADFVADLGRLLGLGLELRQPSLQLVDRPLKRQSIFGSCHVRVRGSGFRIWSSGFIGVFSSITTI